MSKGKAKRRELGECGITKTRKRITFCEEEVSNKIIKCDFPDRPTVTFGNPTAEK